MQKMEEQFQAMRDLEATQANVYSMRMSESEQQVSEAAQEYAQLQQVVLESGASSSSELQANLQTQFKASSDEVKAAQKAESQAQQQMQGVHTAEVAARQLQGALQRQQQELEFECANLQTDRQMHTKHCEFQAEEMTARDVEWDVKVQQAECLIARAEQSASNVIVSEQEQTQSLTALAKHEVHVYQEAEARHSLLLQ